MWRSGILAIVLLAALVPAAQSRIVVQRSIAGVSLGMTRAQVVALLGPPSTQRAPVASDPDRTALWTFPDRLTVGFMHDGDAVTLVQTASAKERTASGAGVGVSLPALKRRLKGEHCNDFGCIIGTFALGSVNTDFNVNRSGRVRFVRVFRQRENYVP